MDDRELLVSYRHILITLGHEVTGGAETARRFVDACLALHGAQVSRATARLVGNRVRNTLADEERSLRLIAQQVRLAHPALRDNSILCALERAPNDHSVLAQLLHVVAMNAF